eukprot:TRINITY_DN51829_c0_g1_i1.p1 TRINITY_DN51829_c0_g1~~TRINITY_DN51829_c0_g1_i1.p1  ORF type:complete len:377 (+),score=23.42 TRINITY_DN51829_c0_g1_i1:106-1236(+)
MVVGHLAGQLLGTAAVFLTQKLVQGAFCGARAPAIPSTTVLLINGTALSGKTALCEALAAQMPHATSVSEHHQYVGVSGVPLSRVPFAEARDMVLQYVSDVSSHGRLVILDMSDSAQQAYEELTADAPPFNPVIFINVLVFTPLQLLPQRLREARAQRTERTREVRYTHAWHPTGGSPFSSVWLPIIQFATFFRGVVRVHPVKTPLQTLTRKQVAEVIQQVEELALSEGGNQSDVKAEASLVSKLLHTSLGLDQADTVCVYPRANFDLTIDTTKCGTPKDEVSQVAKFALQAHRAGGLQPVQQQQPAAPEIDLAGGVKLLFRYCDQCVKKVSHSVCHACISTMLGMLTPAQIGALETLVDGVVDKELHSLERFITG